MKTDDNLTLPALEEALRASLNETQSQWLDQAIEKIVAQPDDQETQLTCSAMTKRKLGDDLIPGLQYWTQAEAARVVLLERYIQPNNYRDAAIWQAYKLGDESEKIAIIKALQLLDSNGSLVELARHAGRTNNIQLFAALALRNPYPVLHYDEPAFHQLVLKTLFMDLNIEAVFNLPSRHSEQLSQKCMELVHERLAAMREPPASIWLAIRPEHLHAEDQALMLTFLEHTDESTRRYCKLALKHSALYDKYKAMTANPDTP